MASDGQSTWSWTVESSAAGLRADKAIHEALTSSRGEWTGEQRLCSRSQLQNLIEDGRAHSSGRVIKSNEKLKTGDRIELRFPAPKSLELIPENRPLDILYQDEHLLVVNKPPGLTVHPSVTQTEGTLVHALLHHIQDLSGIGGVLRPGIVHRIDKDTSGALVITKTDAAHQKLAEVFARHAIDRAYWAICFGAPEGPSQGKPVRIETLIDRHPTDRKKMSSDVKEGRKAITYYRKLEEYAQPKARPFASLIEATLETGRTHQVRVHLSGLGHSLLGDPIYGKPSERHTKWLAMPAEIREAVSALAGQALHARLLGFEHPVTGQKLRFEAEPPAQFARLLELLKSYA